MIDSGSHFNFLTTKFLILSALVSGLNCAMYKNLSNFGITQAFRSTLGSAFVIQSPMSGVADSWIDDLDTSSGSTILKSSLRDLIVCRMLGVILLLRLGRKTSELLTSESTISMASSSISIAGLSGTVAGIDAALGGTNEYFVMDSMNVISFSNRTEFTSLLLHEGHLQ